MAEAVCSPQLCKPKEWLEWGVGWEWGWEGQAVVFGLSASLDTRQAASGSTVSL